MPSSRFCMCFDACSYLGYGLMAGRAAVLAWEEARAANPCVPTDHSVSCLHCVMVLCRNSQPVAVECRTLRQWFSNARRVSSLLQRLTHNWHAQHTLSVCLRYNVGASCLKPDKMGMSKSFCQSHGWLNIPNATPIHDSDGSVTHDRTQRHSVCCACCITAQQACVQPHSSSVFRAFVLLPYSESYSAAQRGGPLLQNTRQASAFCATSVSLGINRITVDAVLNTGLAVQECLAPAVSCRVLSVCAGCVRVWRTDV